MGRGGSTDTTTEATPRRPVGLDNFQVLVDAPEGDVGSEAYRRDMQDYARMRTNRSDITVRFSGNLCYGCSHEEEDHTDNYGECSKQGCDCNSYVSGGGSCTDMRGNITVQSDAPAGAEAAIRGLAMKGLLRHEVCHELYTDPEMFRLFVEEANKLRAQGKEVTAHDLHRLWNILEDGMIETHERHTEPSSYRYISGLNLVYPRAGVIDTTTAEKVYPAPEGYVPVDADGNELNDFFDGQDMLGNPVRMVRVPAGTRLDPWGDKPISKHAQMETALLCESIPEFRPGVGHARLIKNETRLPLPEGSHTPVDVDGNPLKVEGGEVIVPAGTFIDEHMRGAQPLHPDVQACLDECKPLVDQATRGNSAECIARAYDIHEILKKHGLARDDLTPEEREKIDEIIIQVNPMGVSAPQDQQGEGQQGQPGPPQPGGSGNPAPNGPPQDSDEMSDDMKDALQNGSKDKNKPSSGQKRGGQDSLPEGAREQDEQKGAGSMGGDEMDKEKEKSKEEVDGANKRDKEDREGRQKSGNLRAEDMESSTHGNVTSQSELRDKALRKAANRLRQRESRPVAEDPELKQLGVRLGMKLEDLETTVRQPVRRQTRGNFDHKRAGAMILGKNDVFKRSGRDLGLDLEITVSVDRSGSVTGDPAQNEGQQRMAKMCGHAAKQTGIPIAIYGWTSGGGYGGASHSVYKEYDSDDLTAIDVMASDGGGGTPTDEGIRYARDRASLSKRKEKVMIVVTDGDANDIESARRQVEQARKEDITVVGVGFTGVTKQSMDETFGPGSWVGIDDYREVPNIIYDLVSKAARKAAERLGH